MISPSLLLATYLASTPEPSPSTSLLPDLSDANPEAKAELKQLAVTDIPNTVLWWCLAGGAVVLLWLLIKHLARRDSSFALRLFDKLDPQVQALRIWIANAPVTFIYIACWTITSVVVQGTPQGLAGIMTRFSSTNIFAIFQEPLHVLFTSAFLVADYGFAYWLYVIVYVLITARLEQRIGSARVILVGAGAHVLGSITIVAIETLAISMHWLPKATVITQDVGVSYVMVGTCGAYLLFVSAKWRWWYRAAIAIGILGPLIISNTIWDLGHFLATTFGFLLGLLARRYGVRARQTWRALVSSHPPRALPTWDTTWSDGRSLGS